MDRERAQDLATIFVDNIEHPMDPPCKNIVRIVRRDYFMHGNEDLFALSQSLSCFETFSDSFWSMIADKARKLSLDALQDIQFILRGIPVRSETISRWIAYKKGRNDPYCDIVHVIDTDFEMHKNENVGRLADRMGAYLKMDQRAVGDILMNWSQLSLHARQEIDTLAKCLGHSLVFSLVNVE